MLDILRAMSVILCRYTMFRYKEFQHTQVLVEYKTL